MLPGHGYGYGLLNARPPLYADSILAMDGLLIVATTAVGVEREGGGQKQ